MTFRKFLKTTNWQFLTVIVLIGIGSGLAASPILRVVFPTLKHRAPGTWNLLTSLLAVSLVVATLFLLKAWDERNAP